MMEFTSSNTFGELAGAKNNTIINKIFDCVSYILSHFVADLDENENSITDRLCKVLNTRKKPEYSFYFHHQNIENAKSGTSTDFAVFKTVAFAEVCNKMGVVDFTSLVKFEAKRLSSVLRKRREKEYVHGEYKRGVRVKNSGAIERFKNGLHGLDVTHVGIIGYIQTGSPKCWFEKVNYWIQEQIESSCDKLLVWDNDDLLVLDYSKGTLSCYNSTSKRVTGDSVKIKHFWVDFIHDDFLIE